MTCLFISDLHLMESRPDITEALFNFLARETADAQALYVLGDLFEVWLGDDHDTPFNREIIQAFASLPCPHYLMHGNRDFLLGDAFCQATGFQLLPDPVVHEIGGEPTLLMHGDSLCTRDEQYMQVRAMLRNPAVQADLLSKSLEERAAIATGARADSKAHTRETAMDIMDVTPEEVVRVMQEHTVRRLIHGHTHRPASHELDLAGQHARRIVLGDWDQLGWVLKIDDNSEALVSFPI